MLVTVIVVRVGMLATTVTLVELVPVGIVIASKIEIMNEAM